MHEGDSRDGGAQIRPPGPSDRPAPAAGDPAAGDPAAGNRALGSRATGRFQRWLTFLVVAVAFFAYLKMIRP